jgi:predicted phage tail component-like protein
MYELILENKTGDQINFSQNTAFTITDIEGLNPPSATINTSQIALMDGAKFNSSKLNMRTINVAFAIEYQAAKNRIEVFKVLKSKQWIKLTYNGQYRQVWIEGYIGSIDISYFAMKQIVTCSIICPSPYFKGAQTIVNELNNIINAFHFPFSSTADPQLLMGYYSEDLGIDIENDGDVECGMIIELYARAAVSDPTIYDYISKEFIGLKYDMEEADLITIDTRQGQKTVTLLRDGVESSLFNYVIQNSTWLQLPPNGSSFVFDVGSGSVADLSVTFNHDNLYEGV